MFNSQCNNYTYILYMYIHSIYLGKRFHSPADISLILMLQINNFSAYYNIDMNNYTKYRPSFISLCYICRLTLSFNLRVNLFPFDKLFVYYVRMLLNSAKFRLARMKTPFFRIYVFPHITRHHNTTHTHTLIARHQIPCLI